MGEEAPQGIQPGTEAFRHVKNRINEEGWQGDDDGDGEAAVFIGTREEAAAALERLESKEATFADLRSYVGANSVVVAAPEEIKELGSESSGKFQKGSAGSFVFISMGTKPEILFKSKDGSLKRCELDLDRIGGMDEYTRAFVLNREHSVLELTKHLKEIGFIYSSIGISNSSSSGGVYEQLLKARETKLRSGKAGQEFEF